MRFVDVGGVGHATDVAADEAPVAEPLEQMAEHRGGGALALGAGDHDHAIEWCALQPEAEAPDEGDAVVDQRARFGAVATDTGRLDDDLAVHERREAARREFALVGDHDRLDVEGAQLVDVGAAFHAEAPHADGAAAEVSPRERRSHSRRR